MKPKKIVNYFNEEMLERISFVSDNSFDFMDNNERADEIISILNEYGFTEVGCGTNRIVVKDTDNSDIVFKIALDHRGNVDNFSEFRLSKEVPKITNIAVADTYDNNGLILISEFCPTMTSDDMYEYHDEVMSQLNILKDYYILNDVGPKSFKNWGFKRIDGNDIPILIDYAYLTSMENVTRNRCGKCGHKLLYSEDFEYLECKKCGTIYSFSQIADPNTLEDELGFNTNSI